MIRESAAEMLDLIKNNDGLKSEAFNGNNMELQKIVDLILSECRFSVLDNKGNYARFGSSTDMKVIKILIGKLLSNSNVIPPEVVSMALTKEGVIGPFKKIDFEKKYDDNSGLYDVEMEEVFPNEFHVNMFKNNMELRENFINQILRPYVKNIILENDVLMSKSPVMSFINKYIIRLIVPPKSQEELIDSLIAILAGVLVNTDKSLIENIANYIFTNIMNNKYFKAELVNRTIDTTELQKLGRISVGFSSLVENMSYETLQMIELRSFPYGEIISIKDTFYTLTAVLEALQMNFENMDETEIMKSIERINMLYNVTNKNKHKTEVKYRLGEISNSKYGSASDFVSPDNIKVAMLNACKMIKVLVNKRDEIDDKTYVKEVRRIHYRFIKIQAFESANGRTARAIVNIMLQSKGLVGIFRKEKRSDYLAAIEEANKVIKDNEVRYLEALVNNPMECAELENNFLNVDKLPFILVKG